MEKIKQKIDQTFQVLEELDIDLWLVLCRETEVNSDPAMELVVGHNVVWTSAFIYSKKKEAIAIIGNLDKNDFERSGCFTEIIPYVEDFGKILKAKLKAMNPGKIALNYSLDNVSADGLSLGLYKMLNLCLEGTPFINRFMSAEEIISKIRGRKSHLEIENIKRAVEIANVAWKRLISKPLIGLTEIEISEKIQEYIKNQNSEISFQPIVNAGSKSSPGHGLPTHARLVPGDLLHVDFGAKYNNYCSDIQRLAYFRKQKTSVVPKELSKAFNKVKTIIDETSKMYKTGALGYQIDQRARDMLKEDLYSEYDHGLGHQIGLAVHDGGSMVGPRWERYGVLPEIPLELNNTFTIELGIELPEIGYVGLEEDLVVTDKGGVFLGERQTDLVIL